ncbi:MAG: hypothetical protein LBC30_03420 [Puniceicoccales bacterium]|jgi:hypothetical protein|nr:hypothetical protein [Puniceicoccales bacterium]
MDGVLGQKVAELHDEVKRSGAGSQKEIDIEINGRTCKLTAEVKSSLLSRIPFFRDKTYTEFTLTIPTSLAGRECETIKFIHNQGRGVAAATQKAEAACEKLANLEQEAHDVSQTEIFDDEEDESLEAGEWDGPTESTEETQQPVSTAATASTEKTESTGEPASTFSQQIATFDAQIAEIASSKSKSSNPKEINRLLTNIEHFVEDNNLSEADKGNMGKVLDHLEAFLPAKPAKNGNIADRVDAVRESLLSNEKEDIFDDDDDLPPDSLTKIIEDEERKSSYGADEGDDLTETPRKASSPEGLKKDPTNENIFLNYPLPKDFSPKSSTPAPTSAEKAPAPASSGSASATAPSTEISEEERARLATDAALFDTLKPEDQSLAKLGQPAASTGGPRPMGFPPRRSTSTSTSAEKAPAPASSGSASAEITATATATAGTGEPASAFSQQIADFTQRISDLAKKETSPDLTARDEIRTIVHDFKAFVAKNLNNFSEKEKKDLILASRNLHNIQCEGAHTIGDIIGDKSLFDSKTISEFTRQIANNVREIDYFLRPQDSGIFPPKYGPK